MSDISNSDSEDSLEQTSDSEIEIPNPINKIKLRPSRLLEISTMANIILSKLRTLTDVILQYEGNIKVLNNFIKAVDEVYATTNTLALSRM